MTVHYFDAFELDVRAGELRRDGAPVRLQPQPFKVLALLVERPGELVTRDELRKALWGEDTYVDFDRGVNFCVNQVRAALEDSAEAPRFIQTLPRRGYRFIVPVSVSGAQPAAPEREAAPVIAGAAALAPGAPASLAEEERRRETPSLQSVSAPERRACVLSRQSLLAALVLGAVLVSAAVFVGERMKTPPAAASSRMMVAVLPLEDLTGDPPPSWFADGLTEELITQLGQANPKRLGVIARRSAMTYRGSNKSIAEIGRELGVSHIVEGSVRHDGGRSRITVQLIDARTQSPVWSDTYERARDNALTVQSEVAAQVTRALAIELLPDASSGLRASARSSAADDAYLRGKYFLNRGGADDLQTALQQFGAAARADATHAEAHAAMADGYHQMAMRGALSPREAYAKAATAAREAVRLNDDLAAGHAALGVVQLWAEWNPAAAATSFRRALALNPSDATAHHDYAWSLVALQRFDEAVEHVTRARELDPVSARANTDVGWIFLQLRQPSAAVRACSHTLQLDPGYVEAQICLESAYLQLGRYPEALDAARASLKSAGAPWPVALSAAGDPREQLQWLWTWRLDRLRAAAGSRYVSPYTIAMHHVMVGDADAALGALERSVDERAPSVVLLSSDPVFHALHANPRFDRLLQRAQAAR